MPGAASSLRTLSAAAAIFFSAKFGWIMNPVTPHEHPAARQNRVQKKNDRETFEKWPASLLDSSSLWALGSQRQRLCTTWVMNLNKFLNSSSLASRDRRAATAELTDTEDTLECADFIMFPEHYKLESMQKLYSSQSPKSPKRCPKIAFFFFFCPTNSPNRRRFITRTKTRPANV